MRGRITEKTLIGSMLCSMGTGMLIVIVFPWWGFIVAGLMVVVGVILLYSC